jgi:hypothetical protein
LFPILNEIYLLFENINKGRKEERKKERRKKRSITVLGGICFFYSGNPSSPLTLQNRWMD